MNVRFGIQEKSAILVMLVAIVAVLGTASFLQRISADMVEDHELVDLGDEATLRAWEIIDQVNSYRAELGKLAADPVVQEAVYQDRGSELAIRGAETCPRWTSYLRVQVTTAGGAAIGAPVVERSRALDERGLRDLVTQAEGQSQSIPVVSELHRTRAEIRIPGAQVDDQDVWRERWMTMFWGCVRIAPPPDWPEATRYLTAAFPVRPFRSPRHLFFLVDYENEAGGFVIHPDMATEEKFGTDGLFAVDLREELRREQRPPLEASTTPIEGLAILKAVPLQEGCYFYFKEGIPTPRLTEALEAKRVKEPDTYESFLKAILEEHETSKTRSIGGLATKVDYVRLLSTNRKDVDHQHRGEPLNFLRSIEEDLRFLAGMPTYVEIFHWRHTMELKHCHICCLKLDLDLGHGTHPYLMMYAGFQEEFMGAIQQEIRANSLSWIVIFGLSGLLIASFAAAFFVRPIRQMTATAQRIVSEEGVLHEQLAKLATTLPVTRSDEVGDIARASKRLFEEIIESQEQLEQRVRDRTVELERANAQLESLAKEKDAFLANVSHELRTPLTAVSGFLQLIQRKLERQVPLGEKERSYVAKSLAASSHLETLIDDILDFQKIIMGGVTLDPQEFKIGDFLMELRDALQFQAQKNGNQLEVSWDHKLVTVDTDRHRLRQVLTNLISNACKFTHEGLIRVEAKRFKQEDSLWVRIRVIDQGRGMTPEQQAKLFTRFYTTKPSNQSGTGLGLVISEGLAKMMGGRVYLERSEVDKGSTFTLELPMHCPRPSETHPGPQLQSSAS